MGASFKQRGPSLIFLLLFRLDFNSEYLFHGIFFEDDWLRSMRWPLILVSLRVFHVWEHLVEVPPRWGLAPLIEIPLFFFRDGRKFWGLTGLDDRNNRRMRPLIGFFRNGWHGRFTFLDTIIVQQQIIDQVSKLFPFQLIFFESFAKCGSLPGCRSFLRLIRALSI